MDYRVYHAVNQLVYHHSRLGRGSNVLETFDRVAGGMFLAAAAVIGVGRVLVGAHYPADVLAGCLVASEPRCSSYASPDPSSTA
jgi:PAP2 superfamily protein